MKTRFLAVAALAGALFLLAGCSTVNTVQREVPEGTPEYVNDKRVITDGGLAKIAKVKSVNQGTVSGDLLQVQVIVENTSSRPRSFNYRFEWYDMNGMLVQTPAGWRSITLRGKETGALQAVAPNPRAKDFVLKLEETR